MNYGSRVIGPNIKWPNGGAITAQWPIWGGAPPPKESKEKDILNV